VPVGGVEEAHDHDCREAVGQSRGGRRAGREIGS
jgi:hypothetical protein